MPFPYRNHRCHCGLMAIENNADGDPVCANHRDAITMEQAMEECIQLGFLVGITEYDRLLDERFPGDDHITFISNRELYDWARFNLAKYKERSGCLPS